ncbi:MAG: HNH endonuclease [Chloroflexota bacterium]|nr:HNH endonuclease [Chloroflexota bacterium]
MTRTYIPRSLRQRLADEFQSQCAYCHTSTAITGARLVIDHIVPESAGGPTRWENLCLACHSCNEFKGAIVESEDPLTGEIVSLFNPRTQRWNEHFCWGEDGSEIIGRTSVGRTTVAALKMNNLEIVESRRRWVFVGWHPPEEDLQSG